MIINWRSGFGIHEGLNANKLSVLFISTKIILLLTSTNLCCNQYYDNFSYNKKIIFISIIYLNFIINEVYTINNCELFYKIGFYYTLKQFFYILMIRENN